MSFETWLRIGHLQTHSPTVAELQQLLAIADRNLRDAQLPALSADNQHAIAYAAALALCTIALHAAGYQISKRASKHHLTINSLELTLGATPPDRTRFLSK